MLKIEKNVTTDKIANHKTLLKCVYRQKQLHRQLKGTALKFEMTDENMYDW